MTSSLTPQRRALLRRRRWEHPLGRAHRSWNNGMTTTKRGRPVGACRLPRCHNRISNGNQTKYIRIILNSLRKVAQHRRGRPPAIVPRSTKPARGPHLILRRPEAQQRCLEECRPYFPRLSRRRGLPVPARCGPSTGRAAGGRLWAAKIRTARAPRRRAQLRAAGAPASPRATPAPGGWGRRTACAAPHALCAQSVWRAPRRQAAAACKRLASRRRCTATAGSPLPGRRSPTSGSTTTTFATRSPRRCRARPSKTFSGRRCRCAAARRASSRLSLWCWTRTGRWTPAAATRGSSCTASFRGRTATRWSCSTAVRKGWSS
mmetsp:Transcript_41404/g.105896  ORF Transcript_41404/g.105896 Transcript_41404/m.105896 type:complete len:319 (+) Transcript_41404:45-1001(+)